MPCLLFKMGFWQGVGNAVWVIRQMVQYITEADGQYCFEYAAQMCTTVEQQNLTKSVFFWWSYIPRDKNIWCVHKVHSGFWKIVARKQIELATCGLWQITAKLWKRSSTCGFCRASYKRCMDCFHTFIAHTHLPLLLRSWTIPVSRKCRCQSLIAQSLGGCLLNCARSFHGVWATNFVSKSHPPQSARSCTVAISQTTDWET
jgi:hypothetical protein